MAESAITGEVSVRIENRAIRFSHCDVREITTDRPPVEVPSTDMWRRYEPSPYVDVVIRFRARAEYVSETSVRPELDEVKAVDWKPIYGDVPIPPVADCPDCHGTRQYHPLVGPAEPCWTCCDKSTRE